MSTSDSLRRSAAHTVKAVSSALIRVRPLRAIRCPRCDHPYSSDEGKVDDESSSTSSMGQVEEEQVCRRCARARALTLLLMFLLFGAAGAAVMFFAPAV